MTKVKASAQFEWFLEQDERFDFFNMSFDVKLAKQAIHKRPRDVQPFAIDSSVPMCERIGVSPTASLEGVDLAVPVIIATLPKGSLLPIDGWHRIAKAGRDGLTDLPCVVLTKQETARIMR